jgi:hypothetical protein
MTNYNKKGYSTREIAQILGCTITTVHNMINSHRLGAMIVEPTTPNGRRVVRITREHFQDFIRANPDRFSDAEKRIWGVDVDTDAVYTKESIDLDSLPNKPTGAWASVTEMENDLGIRNEELKLPWNEKQEEANIIPNYSVIVNGRIAVAGVTKETAIAITTALLNDTGNAVFDDISIKAMK